MAPWRFPLEGTVPRLCDNGRMVFRSFVPTVTSSRSLTYWQGVALLAPVIGAVWMGKARGCKMVGHWQVTPQGYMQSVGLLKQKTAVVKNCNLPPSRTLSAYPMGNALRSSRQWVLALGNRICHVRSGQKAAATYRGMIRRLLLDMWRMAGIDLDEKALPQ